MKNILGIILYIMCFVVIGNSQKISESTLAEFIENDRVDCVIVMHDQLDLYGKTNGMIKNRKSVFVFNSLKNHSSKSQESIKAYLSTNTIKYQSFHIFNGLQAYLTIDQAEYIVANFEVESIVYNKPSRVSDISKTKEDQSREIAEWGILQIKADSVWQLGFEGSGVVVGGQDTGYDFDNSLIVNKYRGYEPEGFDHNYNWHDAIDTVNVLNGDTINDPSVNPCGFSSEVPCDDHGHGTHTMGTMVGQDSINDIGVAPKASWIGCRNMDRGWGKPSTYTECFEWFLAPTDLDGLNPDPTMAPHVINNSWGCPELEGCNASNWMFMETVVNNLSAAGTVVVVSAGNSGSAGCGSVSNPAAIFENSLTIGASDIEDNKAGFSSIGPVVVDSTFRMKPDVVAPGVGVRSIFLNEEFRTWNGTSMAGPHVAGAVALIINANPNLAGQVDVIKNILRSTAVPLIDSTECFMNDALAVPNFYYGHGRIDVLAAVKVAIDMSTDVVSILVKNEVNVFPNPNSGSFIIETEDGTEIERIIITDMAGREVAFSKSKLSKSSIQISNIESGLYFYSVKTGDSKVTGKVVITN
ncbi:MAG: serine protease AprX [Saprospiraceae bacterium]|jgi:serine protease AprX